MYFYFYTKDIVPAIIYHYSTMSTASTGLTFLYQRQCPHHHIPLVHCMHCVHWFDFLHQRQCPHHHIPLFHCIHFFDLFAPKTMSSPLYIAIILYTASTPSTGLTFLHQRQCLHYYIPLFHGVYCIHCIPCIHCVNCIHCILQPLCTVSTESTVSTSYCIHCILCPLHTASTGLTFLHQRQCPHHHIPLFHYIHWFDLSDSLKTMSPPLYTAIPLHPLYSLHPLI